MKKTFILSMLCVAAASTMQAQRDTININRGWTFRYDGQTATTTVNLPHDYQISQPWVKPDPSERPDLNNDAANIKSRLSARGFKEMGKGIYTYSLTPDNSWQGKRILLDFGGIMLTGDVYLNGELIGGTDYGYLGFECDLTNRLRFGQSNEIKVICDTQGPKNSRWYTGGGLYRDVNVILTPKRLYFERHPLYITTKNNNEVDIQANLTYQDRVKAVKLGVRILDANGKVAAEQTSDLTYYPSWRTREYKLPPVAMPNAHVWDLDNPYLYTAEVTLYDSLGQVADRVSESFGIRTISFGPEYGFKLNGKKVLLKGNANHHGLGCLGAAAFPRAIEKRIKLLKEFGFNTIRCSHNPYSEDLYKLCDKYGVLVVDELYDKWLQLYAGGRKPWNQIWQYDVSEWVQRDRNHPSVILWSLGNELQQMANMDYNDWGITDYRLLKTLLHRYDTTRLTTVAMHPHYRSLDTNDKPAPLAVETEVNSYNYRYMYFPGDAKLYPNKTFFQSEASTADMGPNFFCMDLNKVIGLAYWGQIDYIGESKGWPYKGWDHGSFYLDLQPKPIAYFLKSMFTEQPVVHAAVLEKQQGVKQWNGINVGTADMSENWNRNAGDTLTLNIFTNCDEVELKLNGRSLGKRANSMDPKQRDKIVWNNVTWQAGKLEAIGYRNGKAVAHHQLETTGKAVALKVVPDAETWHADGNDLQHVTIYAVDSKGRKVFDANNELTFLVDGDATVAGVSNGDMTTDENLAGNRIRLWQGSAMVVLRAGTKPGKVSLSVRSNIKNKDLKLQTF